MIFIRKIINSFYSKIYYTIFPRWKKDIVLLHLLMDGLGDHLMLTPITRYIRKNNPKCIIHVVCPNPEYLVHDPNIDFLSKAPINNPKLGRYTLHYSLKWFKWDRHCVEIMAKCVDIKNIKDILPYYKLKEEDLCWAKKIFSSFPKDTIKIAIVRTSSPWTKNKDWPTERWKELLILAKKEKVIFLDLGKEEDGCLNDFDNCIKLRGKTTVGQLAAILKKSNILITPPSGILHLNAAIGGKSLVICGPYEPPITTKYPNTRYIVNNPYGNKFFGVRQMVKDCTDALYNITAEQVWTVLKEELNL